MTAPGSPRTVIWFDYDLSAPPPLTSAQHIRFVILADTYSIEPKDVPHGDVLLHAGDLTAMRSDDEMERQIHWILTLPHATKVLIAGNHDFSACYEVYDPRGREIQERHGYPPSDVAKVKKLLEGLPENVIYLENQEGSFEVKGKRWMWSPEFEDWAWNYKAGEEAKAIHASIPSDIDVLLTHTPPHSIGGLDRIHNGTSVGCPELTRKMLTDAEMRPRIHAFGHIHEARGVYHHQYPSGGETAFVNAAMVDFDMFKKEGVEECE